MEYGTRFDGSAAETARQAQAAAVGVCFVALMFIALLWVSGLGLRGIWRAITAPAYPTAVCEMCGEPLDGKHPSCPQPTAYSLQSDFGNGPDSSLASVAVIPGMRPDDYRAARGRGAVVAPTVTRAAP